MRLLEPCPRPRTLVRYGLGMPGNQDIRGRAAAWADDVMEALAPVIDACVETLTAEPLTRGDLPGAERRARMVGVIARSARAVVALATGPRAARVPEQEEDEMDHRDDSPETLERLRAALGARLDRLDALLEQKGLAVPPGAWPTARTDGEPVRTA